MPDSRVLIALVALVLLSACRLEIEGDPATLARLLSAPQSPASGQEPGEEADAPLQPSGSSLGPETAKRLYYQFVDDAGSVRFVERLEDVPADWQERVGFVELDGQPPLTPMQARSSRQKQAARSTLTRSAPVAEVAVAAPVVFYSAEWCGWCRKARAHMDQAGIDYELRDVDTPAALSELIAKTGQKGVPVFDVGGRILSGYDPDRLEQLVARR